MIFCNFKGWWIFWKLWLVLIFFSYFFHSKFLFQQKKKKDLQEICDEVNALLAPHMQLINKNETVVMGSELMAKMIDSPQQIQKKTVKQFNSL